MRNSLLLITVLYVSMICGGCSRQLPGSGCAAGQFVDGMNLNLRHYPMSRTPEQVKGLTSGVTQIYASDFHSCAIVNGAAKCWGYLDQTLNPQPAKIPGWEAGVTEIRGSPCYFGCALVSGAVSCRSGSHDVNDPGSDVSTSSWDLSSLQGKTLVDLLVTAKGACVLTAQGEVLCWGTSVTPSSMTPVQLSVPSGATALSQGGDSQAVGGNCFLAQGQVYCWDYHSDMNAPMNPIEREPYRVPGFESDTVTQIAVGGGFYCALTQAGAVKCWGSREFGTLGDGVRGAIPNDQLYRMEPQTVIGLESGVASITANAFHACAVMQDGTARCWGLNQCGQLGTNQVSTAADVNCHKASGRCWSSRPVEVRGVGKQRLEGVTAISAGYAHTCAVAEGGGAFCWGDASLGTLGNGKKRVREDGQVCDGLPPDNCIELYLPE